MNGGQPQAKKKNRFNYIQFHHHHSLPRPSPFTGLKAWRIITLPRVMEITTDQANPSERKLSIRRVFHPKISRTQATKLDWPESGGRSRSEKKRTKTNRGQTVVARASSVLLRCAVSVTAGPDYAIHTHTHSGSYRTRRSVSPAAPAAQVSEVEVGAMFSTQALPALVKYFTLAGAPLTLFASSIFTFVASACAHTRTDRGTL